MLVNIFIFILCLPTSSPHGMDETRDHPCKEEASMIRLALIIAPISTYSSTLKLVKILRRLALPSTILRKLLETTFNSLLLPLR